MLRSGCLAFVETRPVLLIFWGLKQRIIFASNAYKDHAMSGIKPSSVWFGH
jgi:hypothetical protein